MSMTMIKPTNDYLSIHERLLVLHKVAESTRYQDENWYREKGAGRMMGSRPDSPNLLYCHCSTKINSMHSPLFTLLLIVNLLACPIRCLSCETNSSVVVESAPAACDCCQHSEEAPVSETPEPCGDDCSCQSFICEGAVVKPSLELSDVLCSTSWSAPACLVTYPVADLCSLFSPRSFASDWQLLCGRDRCVAHQSWQI